MARALLLGPIQQENLALGYLGAYARARGHVVEIVPYSSRTDLPRVLAAVKSFAPDLVGLGVAFQNSIDEYAMLPRALRDGGYQGHLTCGGHVPTFCWSEMLTELPGLDTVVRHDGEETLTEMLDALDRGETPRGLAGLVWREGTEIVKGPLRPATADLDALPRPTRSDTPYVVGGLTIDFLITARGCVGECSYCSIAAYTSEQKRSYRLRAPDAVADEIACAYHTRGARVFFVQDDLFVLPGDRPAVARMQKIKQGIDARGVRDAVFWIKGRPEHVTRPVAEAARAMGAIHIFLGVENASASRLRYLGRTHLPIHNESAIENASVAGLTPSFNFMLFDPDSSLADVDVTLDMAEKHLDLPWNVCRTEIYSGTELRQRLAAAGRLQGTWRSYGYRMADAQAEVMFRVVRVALHERALAVDSLLNRLISLSFARQLHSHYFPDAESVAMDSQVTLLGRTIRRDTVSRLRQIRARVAEGMPKEALQRWAVELGLEIGAFDMPLRSKVAALWRRYHLRGRAMTAAHGGARPLVAHEGFAIAAGS
jgi:anaerobic magnesium-protoporphyrin IX monomethyl ester cyclase